MPTKRQVAQSNLGRWREVINDTVKRRTKLERPSVYMNTDMYDRYYGSIEGYTPVSIDSWIELLTNVALAVHEFGQQLVEAFIQYPTFKVTYLWVNVNPIRPDLLNIQIRVNFEVKEEPPETW